MHSGIRSAEQLEHYIQEVGFLPFFRNDIGGFSVEELTPRELWFSKDHEGPWEWKGPIIGYGSCVYGKLFQQKAGYVSMTWYPDLINYRRSRFRPTAEETKIYTTLQKHESLLSKELKQRLGYLKPRPSRLNPLEKALQKEAILPVRAPHLRRESFETAMTHLQMAGYVVIATFEYLYDKSGLPYGWGIARYTTPEALYGTEALKVEHTPEQSKQRIFAFLSQQHPEALPRQLWKIIG